MMIDEQAYSRNAPVVYMQIQSMDEQNRSLYVPYTEQRQVQELPTPDEYVGRPQNRPTAARVPTSA
jgi:hypothetical protein